MSKKWWYFACGFTVCLDLAIGIIELQSKTSLFYPIFSVFLAVFLCVLTVVNND